MRLIALYEALEPLQRNKNLEDEYAHLHFALAAHIAGPAQTGQLRFLRLRRHRRARNRCIPVERGVRKSASML